jgi:hypothetical protein
VGKTLAPGCVRQLVADMVVIADDMVSGGLARKHMGADGPVWEINAVTHGPGGVKRCEAKPSRCF